MLAFLLNRYTWIFGAMLALSVGAFFFGVRWEGNRRDAQQLRIERAARASAERQRREWDDRNRELSLALAHSRDANRALERRLNERINHVTTSDLVAVAAPAGGAPAVTFTPGFIGLYNGALARMPAPAAGTDGAGAAGGAVGPQDLLVNLNENGAEFESCRDQLKAWQDWARTSGLVR
jgi:hypothetical protein